MLCLSQYISSINSIDNKEVASAVVHLPSMITLHVSGPLLRLRLSQILTSLPPASPHSEADAPLLRHSIGCLESLPVVENTQVWASPPDVSPPRVAAGLLAITVGPRSKVGADTALGYSALKGTSMGEVHSDGTCDPSHTWHTVNNRTCFLSGR